MLKTLNNSRYTSLRLYAFQGYQLGREIVFGFLKTEKYWENYYGQLAVAVPSHPLHKKSPGLFGGENDQGIESTEC